MKKSHLILIAALFSSFSMFGQDLSVRGGLGYATQSEKLGIQFGALYTITSEVDIAGGFSFFSADKASVPDGFGGTIKNKARLWMFDINGHYNLDLDGPAMVYPLAGLNFTTSSLDINNRSSSKTKLGLNVGVGAIYPFSDLLSGLLELKYILGDADQGVIGFGIQYRL